MRAALYLGVGHIHDVLVSLYTLHDVEAVAVQHLGLCAARHHQDDITSDAVLQGLDLMAEDTHTMWIMSSLVSLFSVVLMTSGKHLRAVTVKDL